MKCSGDQGISSQDIDFMGINGFFSSTSNDYISLHNISVDKPYNCILVFPQSKFISF